MAASKKSKKTRKPKEAAESPPLFPDDAVLAGVEVAGAMEMNSELETASATEVISESEIISAPVAQERGRFIIEKMLGRGGVCEVYEALDLVRAELNDARARVALKKLRPEFKEQLAARLALAQEFAKTRALNHPGIIQVYDLHHHGGELCLSMELMEAPTLKERLRRGPQIEASDARTAAGKIFQALAHIHERGLVHADLKPGNIFLKAGQPVIFDFNIAVAVPRPGQAAVNPVQALVDSKNIPAGTTVYSAPERLAGEAPSQADDVFSAAVTIYEMLSGRHPFGRRSSSEAVVEGDKPGRPELLGRRHWRYLEAAMSFEPARRPTAEELANIYVTGTRTNFNPIMLRDDLRHMAADIYGRVSGGIRARSGGLWPRD
ncbi:serine/threonine protein kinase [Deltaproteobacteria bacterium Smac51]|nr:serine/threonine protein kinase [Deltaproteobacteria bacterium Smac51]